MNKNKLNNIYSDGDEIENSILEFFKKEPTLEDTKKFLHKNNSWSYIYHLSPIRHNLLSWYDFKKNSTLLEVGAGCGALTGLFCKKVKTVHALELSKRRADIIKTRFKRKKNIEVFSGKFEEFNTRFIYDYISVIGVLEYVGKYSDSKEPHLIFLRKIYNKLKTGGIMILAIENRFGLKYWSGCTEDHTGRLFDSLEGYPNGDKIKTFGKVELTKLLKKAGFDNQLWYYPLPDYKICHEIFSEKYLPSIKHNLSVSHFPFNQYTGNRNYLFNEKLVMDGLIENNLFESFANSFLIFCTKE